MELRAAEVREQQSAKVEQWPPNPAEPLGFVFSISKTESLALFQRRENQFLWPEVLVLGLMDCCLLPEGGGVSQSWPCRVEVLQLPEEVDPLLGSEVLGDDGFQ